MRSKVHGRWAGGAGNARPSALLAAVLCRILDMNFAEFLFYDVGWIGARRGRMHPMLRDLSASLFEQPQSPVWYRKWARPRLAQLPPANANRCPQTVLAGGPILCRS